MKNTVMKMKWRAEVELNIVTGEIIQAINGERFSEEMWATLISKQGEMSIRGGVWYYVEVDDDELPEVPV